MSASERYGDANMQLIDLFGFPPAQLPTSTVASQHDAGSTSARSSIAGNYVPGIDVAFDAEVEATMIKSTLPATASTAGVNDLELPHSIQVEAGKGFAFEDSDAAFPWSSRLSTPGGSQSDILSEYSASLASFSPLPTPKHNPWAYMSQQQPE